MVPFVLISLRPMRASGRPSSGAALAAWYREHLGMPSVLDTLAMAQLRNGRPVEAR